MSPVKIELAGLELFGHHGVTEEERRRGQRFIFDVWVSAPERSASDRLEDTIDYRDVAALVGDVSAAREYHLLEALAAAVADALLVRFETTWARVRVRKPEVELDPAVDYAAVTVERSST